MQTIDSNDIKDLEKVYHAWCNSFSEATTTAKSIVNFYAPDAILIPTFSDQILFNTDNGLAGYFERLLKFENIKCTSVKLITRMYGDTAINCGFYNFSYTKAGELKVLPARFNFVYRKVNNEWLIVNHQSSLVPPPPT